jgi:hypothetical protein
MLQRLTLAAVAAATLTAVPAARAAPVAVTCALAAVAQADAAMSMPFYTGAVAGVALFDDGQPHTLRCYVTVDDFEQVSTPAGEGTGVVAAAGPVTYGAADGAAVHVCAETDALLPGGPDTTCWRVNTTRVPPQAAADVVDAVAAALLDPVDPAVDGVLCPLLASLAPGIPGVVDVDPDGDTTVLGQVVRECPPYGAGHGTRLPGPVRLQTRTP